MPTERLAQKKTRSKASCRHTSSRPGSRPPGSDAQEKNNGRRAPVPEERIGRCLKRQRVAYSDCWSLAGNKCRLSLRESSVLRFFRGAKDDIKKPRDADVIDVGVRVVDDPPRPDQ